MIKINSILKWSGKENEYQVSFNGWVGNSPFLEYSGTFFFVPDKEFDPERDHEYIRNQIRNFIIANI